MKGYGKMRKKEISEMKESKFVPLKNYYIAILIIIGAILVTLYVFKWYQVKKDEKLRTSYFVSTETVSLKVSKLEEIDQVFIEAPATYFVYIGYTQDEDVYKLEKDLKPLIEEYNLKEIFYYIDATKIKTEDDYLDKLSKSLNLTENKLEKIPTIIFFHNDKYEIVKRDDENMMKAADFQKLLDINEFEKISR